MTLDRNKTEIVQVTIPSEKWDPNNNGWDEMSFYLVDHFITLMDLCGVQIFDEMISEAKKFRIKKPL